jgi:hypothetical protein
MPEKINQPIIHILFTAVGKNFKYPNTQISVCTRRNKRWLNFKHTSHWKIQGSHRGTDKYFISFIPTHAHFYTLQPFGTGILHLNFNAHSVYKM